MGPLHHYMLLIMINLIAQDSVGPEENALLCLIRSVLHQAGGGSGSVLCQGYSKIMYCSTSKPKSREGIGLEVNGEEEGDDDTERFPPITIIEWVYFWD